MGQFAGGRPVLRFLVEGDDDDLRLLRIHIDRQEGLAQPEEQIDGNPGKPRCEDRLGQSGHQHRHAGGHSEIAPAHRPFRPRPQSSSPADSVTTARPTTIAL
jgi:hypothetical protein